MPTSIRWTCPTELTAEEARNAGPLAGLRRFGDPDRPLPCSPTPWGELVAVNMDTGDIAYRKTLGLSDMLPPGLKNAGAPVLAA